MKQQILDRLNEIIDDEKGVPVTMNSKFSDAGLDSLGTVLTIATLEAEYPFFKDHENGMTSFENDAFQSLDIENLTVRELIRKCVLSITTQSTEQSNETGT
ncbi:MAG: hypothetical protein GY820_10515 [Gammaproteobacteria bacterium]|nr:hypothetical protein [Gammaproteobacteria bacterium]